MESTGRITKRLSGFHHDFHWKDVGKNLLQLKNQIYDKGKHILQADLADSVQRVTKTFYPKHWSSEKVAKKVVEALKNIESVRTQAGGRLRFIGITKCGIRIQIISEQTGKLVTAFPLV